MEFCAREASQIFGGNSYLRGGVGEKARPLLVPAILPDFFGVLLLGACMHVT
jgi:hypothetical protein